MESFCGKHCEHCLSREAQGCYGCHPEYDPPGYVGCKIAQCCKTHGHVHCGTCQYRNTCHKLSCRDLMPEEKNRTLRLEAERRAELTKKCAFLGRWLWVLFWLFIPAILAWLLTQDAVRDNMSGLYWTGIVLNVALILGRLGILFLISRYSRHFRSLIWCSLSSLGVTILYQFLPSATSIGSLIMSLLFCAVSMILRWLSIRHELLGYEAVLAGINDNLAGKFNRLWRLFRWCFGGVVICLVGMFLIPVLIKLFALAFTGCMCWLLVLYIMMIVNEYRAAKTFREYCPENSTVSG